MIVAAILDLFVALFNVVKEVSLKSVKNKTWDLRPGRFVPMTQSPQIVKTNQLF